MTAPTTARPAADEYAPFYATYISSVPDGDILSILRSQLTETLELLSSIPEHKAGTRYAPGKWSVRQVAGHVCDAERIFSYRALRIARNDHTDLPGYDENTFADHARSDERTLESLCGELRTIRTATLSLFEQFGEAEMRRVGTANGHAVTVRALGWIIAGHERHHAGVIRDRYLPAL